MEIAEKKIVIWCGGASNQKALANKLAKKNRIAGIVIQEKKGSSARNRLLQIPAIAWDRFRFKTIYDGWKNLLQYYEKEFPHWPDVPILRVADINCAESLRFTKELNPDLIIVSGTSLVKGDLLNVPASIGIINLHTGLSPYVKGGPNCTNWCIARNTWHLTGNTIMWLNAGIDSGNIITSEFVDVQTSPTLLDAQKKIMNHAHDLYERAISYLLTNNPPYISVPQHTLGKGSLFLTKMWTAKERSQLLKNWAKRHTAPKMPIPVTISLNTEQRSVQ
jgi:hypothetical protein